VEEFVNELQGLMKSNKIIEINLFGFDLSITDSVVVMWIVMAILIVLSVVFTRKLKTIPEGKQSIVEVIVEFFNNFAKDCVGEHGKLFVPYIGTIFLLLIVSNIIAVFNIIPSGEDLYNLTHWEFFENWNFAIRPPTKDINVTLTLALMSMVAVITAGIKVKKVSGWLKSFLEPEPLILPFKIFDYFIRPVSLCFRMFGNILGAVIIMELIYFAFPAVLPGFLSIYFDLFDGILQAYVFLFLTSLYVGEAGE